MHVHKQDVVCAHARMEDCAIALFACICVCLACIVQSFALTLARGIAVYKLVQAGARSERAKRARSL